MQNIPTGAPGWEVVVLSLAPILASLATLIATLMNQRSIKNVHLLINSRMSELLASSVGEAAAVGKAAGLKEGREEKHE